MGLITDKVLDGDIYMISSSGELFNRHRIRFIWCGTGYRICRPDSNSVCLTLDPDSGKVSMSDITDMKNQIWTVKPHSGSKGLEISTGSRFLCIHGKKIYSSYRKNSDSVITLSPYAGWIRFGALFLQDAGIIRITRTSDAKRAVSNYRKNYSVNISRDNKLRYGNADMLINQTGGSFPSYNFAEALMSDTACEIMATCNAIRMLRDHGSYKGTDFFRLAAEFEISALSDNPVKKAIVIGGKKAGIKELDRVGTRDGDWGSDPYRIRRCLAAYNIKFTEYRNADEMDAALKPGDIVIIAYCFDILHQAIHTYSGKMEEDGLHTFNRYSNHTLRSNYLNEKASPERREIYKNVRHSVNINDPDSRFMTGYVLHSIKE